MSSSGFFSFGCEILVGMFCIDKEKSLQYRTVVIVTKESQGAPVHDLMEDEKEWQKREKKLDRITFFRLRPIHSYVLLQKLAVTQKLMIGDKKVFGDFFSRLKVEYLVDEGYMVHALLQNRALCEYDLILQGSPHIAIQDNRLMFIDPDVAWQDLAPFLSGPKAMTKQEYQRFKKEVAPESLVELVSNEPEVAVEKKACLVDSTCSFIKLDKEQACYEQELIQAGFMKKELASSNYYCPTDKSLSAVYTLLQKGWKFVDAKGSPIVPISSCKIDLQEAKKGYKVHGSITFGPEEIPIENVKDRLLALPSGNTGLLAFDDYTEVKELLELVSEGQYVAKSKVFSLGQRAPKLRHIPNKIGSTSTFKGELRPYQEEGLSWLINLYEHGVNGLLADEMGLGKTVQALAFLGRIEKRALIVVPTSLLHNWKREIEHFLPQKSVAINTGSDKDIIITSYGNLRSNIDRFKDEEYECLILDEAQAIKNSSTLTTQSVLQLKGRFKLSLTGTPIENSLDELKSHFHFLEPELLDDAENHIPTIRKKIAPFLLRRKKSDVAKDLPEKIEESVFVTMSEEQKLVYDRFLGQLKAGLLQKVRLDGLKAHRMEIFEALLRLRQIACHPGLVPQIGEGAPSCKCELVLEDIATLIAEGKKVILFSQFTSMLHILAKEAASRSWPYLLLEGKTQNRQELVDAFQTTNEYPLFFISLKAGGVGLNLTAADYVLLYDPWWNKAQEAQAVDRAHRIGRKGTVFSKRYYVEGTIEEKILALQEKKGQLIEELLEENGAATLELDDLHELFD